MRNKIISLVFAILFLFVGVCVPVAAEQAPDESATSQALYSLVSYARMKKGMAPLYVFDGATKNDPLTDTVGEVKSLVDGILAFKTGNKSIQDWIDDDLSKKPASGAEWYIIALSQNASYGLDTYASALSSYLDGNMPGALQTAQKLALVLVACGKRDGVVKTVADRPTDKAPFMALVFGLHLLNNGIESEACTAAQLKNDLLKTQRSDGGWAITGQNGDVDVTSMVLQALAPYRGETSVNAAVERAVTFLSNRQLSDGGFSTMGKENCESVAQVITALSDLKIDCESDPRFQKNGKSPIDALKLFRLSSGGFSHFMPQTEAKGSAGQNEKTEQKKANAKSDVGLLNEIASKGGTSPDVSDAAMDTGDSSYDGSAEDNAAEKEISEPDKDLPNDEGSKDYKPLALLLICTVAAALAAALFLTKRFNKKNFILLIFILLAAVAFVIFTDFESVSSHNRTVEKENSIGKVTISIRCDTVAGKTDPEYIAKDGLILAPQTFDIEKGDTVYDVLCEAVKKNGLQMEKKGTGGMVYVAGIQYLYEFDFGDMSGWVYHVNGESPFVGCDNYEVKPGDVIEWMYTLDLGVDTGNTFDYAKGEGQ